LPFACASGGHARLARPRRLFLAHGERSADHAAPPV
jgi:hypothetical protein